MGCRITKVLAPNGEESILHRNLTRIAENEAQAMKWYLQAKQLGLGNSRLDSNGELHIEEVIERLSDINPNTRAEFYSVRPDYSIEAGPQSDKLGGLIDTLSAAAKEAERKMDAQPDDQDLSNFFEGALEKITADKKAFLRLQTPATIATIANRQLYFAKEVANKENITDQELQYVTGIAKMWKFNVLREFLTDEQRDTENILNTTFQEIAGVAEGVYNEILEISRKRVANRIDTRNKELGREVGPVDVRRIGDISPQSSWFLDLTHAAPEIAHELAGTLQRAARNPAGDISTITKTLDTLKAGVDLDLLLQKDKDGKDTFTLVHDYSAEYYKETNRLSRKLERAQHKADRLAPKEGNSLLRKAYGNYYRSRKRIEHAVDPRFFLSTFPGHKTREYDSPEAYRRFLVKQYGEERTEELIDDAVNKWNQYVLLRSSAKERFAGDAIQELDKITKENIEQFVATKLKEWEKAHSPVRYVIEAAGNSIITQYQNTDGWKYAVRAPLSKKKNGDDTGYFDARFAELKKDPKALALHTYVVQVMDEMKAYLPTDVSNRLEKNFLAVIQQSLVERYTKDNWSAIHNHLATRTFDAITSDDIIELNDTVVKNERDNVPHAPIRYVNEKAVPEENRSKDVIRLVEMFAAMALHYKSMTEVEDEVLISQRIIQEAEALEKSGASQVVNKVGNLLTKKGGVVNLNRSVEYTIRAAILGKKRVEKEWEGRTIIYGGENGSFKNHKKNKRRARQIRMEKNLLETQLEDGEITAEKYEGELEALQDEYRQLGGKHLVWSGLFNGVLGYAQLKGMGYNITAGITNMSWGLLSNIIHGASETDFTNKQIRQAIRMMLKSRTKRNSKEMILIKMADILFEITEVAYGKAQTRSETRFLSHLKPYELQRRTETIIQGAAYIASMMNTPVMKLDGTEGNLLDAYDSKGNWKTDEYGEANEWNHQKLKGNTRNKWTNFRDKSIQMNKMLHGNYDSNSATLIKSHALGRAMMMFRSWIPEGFAWRLQDQRWDDQLGRDVKGRWISYKDIVTEHGVAALGKTMLISAFKKKGDIEFETGKLSELDIGNMRSNIMELKILLSIAMSGVLVRMAMAGLDDDDEFAYWMGRMYLTQIGRIEQDLTYYASPKGILQVNKNVMPLMSTVTGTAKLLADISDFIVDPDLRDMDQTEKIARNVPLFGQIFRVYDPSTRIVFD